MKNGPYELVIAPDDYPGKKYRNRYCYEHHLVYWKNTGVLPDKDQVIHHKNDNKRDNRFSNLELMCRKKHTSHHAKECPMVTLKCFNCNSDFEREESTYRYKIKIGQDRFFCCRFCQISTQHKDRYGK